MRQFIENRNMLIDKLEKREIDKVDFVLMNKEYFDNLGYTPEKEISSLEEGLFGYQYFNSYAKFHKMKARELKYGEPFIAHDHLKEADKLYKKKEAVTLKILEILGYKDIEAYYITSSSKSLRGRIFEILYHGDDKVILHSKDERIRQSLVKKGLFSKKTRESRIDSYIISLY